MKVWKRNAVVAAIVLFVCVAVYLNWSYSQQEAVASTDVNQDTKTLGEAELVSATDGVDVLGEEETVTVAELPEDSYFDAARLSRQEARDEALAMLQATIDDPNAAEAAIATASESLAALAQSTTTEAEIENLVSAKGYSDCVAYIGENSISVVVATPEDGLQATDVAKITDIVLGQTSFSADQVKIIEAN
jgi:stage III sporulation protein AH